MNDIGIHHHFRLKKDNLGYLEGVRFEHLPLFKLYPASKKAWIRETLESMTVELPHQLQSTIRRISPNPEFFNHYRSEHFPTELIKHGNFKTFARMYQLKQTKHVKVEITVHSKLLAGRKNYDLTSALKAGQQFFNKLERESASTSLALQKHLPDYYSGKELQELILNPIQNYLEAFRNLPSQSSLKRTKREQLKELMNYLEQNSKKIATDCRSMDDGPTGFKSAVCSEISTLLRDPKRLECTA